MTSLTLCLDDGEMMEGEKRKGKGGLDDLSHLPLIQTYIKIHGGKFSCS